MDLRSERIEVQILKDNGGVHGYLLISEDLERIEFQGQSLEEGTLGLGLAMNYYYYYFFDWIMQMIFLYRFLD